MATIKLAQVDQHNWRIALQLSVHPDQQHFVTDIVPVAAIALAKAYVRPLGMDWDPYAIYADENMVGFFELAYPPETYGVCWLFHFFIDQSHQGKGYGRKALKAVIELVKQHYSSCPKLHLTVHPDNVIAQGLYTSAGFQPTGDTLNNEPVYELKLSMSL